ncbi:MAG TPA: ATP-binding cassette domain-containing protein [Acidimicrobiales bacterium]|nr:ATP-binding cassette domain-containing protein [Acidimicrobiales bacterium]
MTPVLDIRGLTVSYGSGPPERRRLVVRGVDLAVPPGEVVALVGESGSGKSSTIRGALGLVPVDAGESWIGGVDLLAASRRERQRLRSRVQMVFQDPYSSLDPLMTVADLVAEPLKVHTDLSRPERVERVAGMLERVGIGRDALRRLPADFSGGQRQRIAIARALVVGPQVLVCDEPVSALDVSTQNQVLDLIRSTCDRDGVGVLLIAHDLAVVRQVADQVAVMCRGEIVEERSCDELFDAPRHTYTRELLDAAPRIGGRRARRA